MLRIEGLPRRLPCLLGTLYGTTESPPAAAFPGFVVYAFASMDSRSYFESQKAVVIVYPMGGGGSEESMYVGTLAEVVGIENAPPQYLALQCRGLMRVKIVKPSLMESSGQSACEWEPIHDIPLDPNTIRSSEFREKFNALMCGAKDIWGARNYILEPLSANVLGALTSEQIAAIIDRISFRFQYALPAPEILELTGRMVGEGSVRARLDLAIKALEAIKRHQKNTGEAELLLPDAIDHALCGWSVVPSREFAVFFPGSLFHTEIFPIPEGLYARFKAMPYVVVLHEESGDVTAPAVGVLAFIRSISFKDGTMLVRLEGDRRVRVTEVGERLSKDIRMISWENIKEIDPTPAERRSNDLKSDIRWLKTLHIWLNFRANNDPVPLRAIDFDDTEFFQFFDLENHPSILSSFVDRVITAFQFEVYSVERIAQLRAMFQELNVLARMELVTEAIEAYVKEVENDGETEQKPTKALVPYESSPKGNSSAPIRASRPLDILENDNDALEMASVEGSLDPDLLSPKAKKLKEFLEANIIGEGGQKKAIRNIVNAYEYYLSPLWRPKKGPIFAGMFLGPSGVGKTEISKQLARFLFGDELGMTKIPCGDFTQPHDVAALTGSPHGYVGYGDPAKLSQGVVDRPAREAEKRCIREKISQTSDEGKKKQLLARVKQLENYDKMLEQVGKRAESGQTVKAPAPPGKFLSVILFDEIEKAHHNLHRLLLEVLQEGRIMTKSGDESILEHSFIIMTGNVASQEIAQALSGGGIGFHPEDRKEVDPYRIVMREIAKKQIFPTEFIGRVKENIAVFNQLTDEEMHKIGNKQIRDLETQLRLISTLSIDVSPDVRRFIVKEGTDHKEYGARLLEQKLRHYVLEPLSRLLNTGQLFEDDSIAVDLEIVGGKPKVVFKKRPKPMPPSGNQ